MPKKNTTLLLIIFRLLVKWPVGVSVHDNILRTKSFLHRNNIFNAWLWKLGFYLYIFNGTRIIAILIILLGTILILETCFLWLNVRWAWRITQLRLNLEFVTILFIIVHQYVILRTYTCTITQGHGLPKSVIT